MPEGSNIRSQPPIASSSSIRPTRTTIHAHLAKSVGDKQKAARYASFIDSLSESIEQDRDLRKRLDELSEGIWASKDMYDVVKGGAIAESAARYLGNLNRLVQEAGLSGKLSIAGVIVDRYSSVAKSQGIELNECALMFAKVALDIGGAGVGAVGSVGGWGIPLLALSILSTFKDSYSLGRACTPQ